MSHVCSTLPMRRPFARRLAAAVQALWFTLYVGVPQVVHPCATHSPVPAAAAQSHGHQTTAAHHGTPSHGPSGRQHECCCPGPQCGVSAIVPPATPWLQDVAQFVADAPPPAPAFAVATRAAYVLPFATAPPASLT